MAHVARVATQLTSLKSNHTTTPTAAATAVAAAAAAAAAVTVTESPLSPSPIFECRNCSFETSNKARAIGKLLLFFFHFFLLQFRFGFEVFIF